MKGRYKFPDKNQDSKNYGRIGEKKFRIEGKIVVRFSEIKNQKKIEKEK